MCFNLIISGCDSDGIKQYMHWELYDMGKTGHVHRWLNNFQDLRVKNDWHDRVWFIQALIKPMLQAVHQCWVIDGIVSDRCKNIIEKLMLVKYSHDNISKISTLMTAKDIFKSQEYLLIFEIISKKVCCNCQKSLHHETCSTVQCNENFNVRRDVSKNFSLTFLSHEHHMILDSLMIWDRYCHWVSCCLYHSLKLMMLH